MKFVALFRFLVPLVATTLFAGDPGPTYDVKSGTVSFSFNFDVVTVPPLSSVRVKPIAPGSLVARTLTVSAPVVGGSLQASDARTEIIASGGYRLTYQFQTVSLVDFIFTLPNDGSPASVSANVTANGTSLGRTTLSTIDVASLNVPLPVAIPLNKKLALKYIPLTLTTDAATLLNTRLGLNNAYNDTDVAGLLTIRFKLGGKL